MVFVDGSIYGDSYVVGGHSTKQNGCCDRYQHSCSLGNNCRNVLNDQNVLMVDRMNSNFLQYLFSEVICSSQIVSAIVRIVNGKQPHRFAVLFDKTQSILHNRINLLFNRRKFARVESPCFRKILFWRVTEHQSLLVQIFHNGPSHFTQILSANVFFKSTNQLSVG